MLYNRRGHISYNLNILCPRYILYGFLTQLFVHMIHIYISMVVRISFQQTEEIPWPKVSSATENGYSKTVKPSATTKQARSNSTKDKVTKTDIPAVVCEEEVIFMIPATLYHLFPCLFEASNDTLLPWSHHVMSVVKGEECQGLCAGWALGMEWKKIVRCVRWCPKWFQTFYAFSLGVLRSNASDQSFSFEPCFSSLQNCSRQEVAVPPLHSLAVEGLNGSQCKSFDSFHPWEELWHFTNTRLVVYGLSINSKMKVKST